MRSARLPGLADRELVAEMRAEMVHGEFELPIVDAVRERDADSIVGCFEVADFVEREPNHGGGLDIELPTLREEHVVGSVAEQADAAAERAIPKRLMRLPLAFGNDRQSRLVHAGLVRAVDEAFWQYLPAPEVTGTSASADNWRAPSGIRSVGRRPERGRICRGRRDPRFAVWRRLNLRLADRCPVRMSVQIHRSVWHGHRTAVYQHILRTRRIAQIDPTKNASASAAQTRPTITTSATKHGERGSVGSIQDDGNEAKMRVPLLHFSV